MHEIEPQGMQEVVPDMAQPEREPSPVPQNPLGYAISEDSEDLDSEDELSDVSYEFIDDDFVDTSDYNDPRVTTIDPTVPVTNLREMTNVLRVYILLMQDWSCEPAEQILSFPELLKTFIVNPQERVCDVAELFQCFVEVLECSSHPDIGDDHTLTPAHSDLFLGYSGGTTFVADVLEQAQTYLGDKHLIVIKLKLLGLFLEPTTYRRQETLARLRDEKVLEVISEEDLEEGGRSITRPVLFQLRRAAAYQTVPVIDFAQNLKTDVIRDIRYAYVFALLLIQSEEEDSKLLARYVLKLCLKASVKADSNHNYKVNLRRQYPLIDNVYMRVAIKYALVELALETGDVETAVRQMRTCLEYELLNSDESEDLREGYVLFLKTVIDGDFFDVSPFCLLQRLQAVGTDGPEVPLVCLPSVCLYIRVRARHHEEEGQRELAHDLLQAALRVLFRREPLYQPLTNYQFPIVDRYHWEVKGQFFLLVRDRLRVTLGGCDTLVKAVAARCHFLGAYIAACFTPPVHKTIQRQCYKVIDSLLYDILNYYQIQSEHKQENVMDDTLDYLMETKEHFPLKKQFVSYVAAARAYGQGDTRLYLLLRATHLYESATNGMVALKDERFSAVWDALSEVLAQREVVLRDDDPAIVIVMKNNLIANAGQWSMMDLLQAELTYMYTVCGVLAAHTLAGDRGSGMVPSLVTQTSVVVFANQEKFLRDFSALLSLPQIPDLDALVMHLVNYN